MSNNLHVSFVSVFVAAIVIFSLFTFNIKGYASINPPYWDVCGTGSGFQNVCYMNGYVGISKSNPSAKIDISGSPQPFRITNSQITTSANYIYGGFNVNNTGEFGAYDSVGGAKKMSISGSAVGVNNGNPNYPLDVNGDINTNANIQASGTIQALDVNKPAGSQFIKVGDDAYLTDVDQANTIGIYGQQNPAEGKVKLGSAGAKMVGYLNGDMCFGVNCQ